MIQTGSPLGWPPFQLHIDMHPLLISSLTPLLRRLIVRKVRFDPNAIADVTFKLAESLEEKTAAFEMARAVYVRHGLIPVAEANRRISVYHLLPNTSIAIAVHHGQVIGTVSMVEDSIVGFPMESIHPKEISELRRTGLRYGEASSVAVAKPYRHTGVLLMLLVTMARWGIHHRQINAFVGAIHPKAVLYYQALMGYRRIGPVQRYASLNNAPSAPIKSWDLQADCRSRFKAIFDRPSMRIGIASGAPNLYQLFYETSFPNMHLPPVPPAGAPPLQPPAWRTADVDAFFKHLKVDFPSLSTHVRGVLQVFYPDLLRHSVQACE